MELTSEEKLVLIAEAANDPSLSDGSFRTLTTQLIVGSSRITPAVKVWAEQETLRAEARKVADELIGG